MAVPSTFNNLRNSLPLPASFYPWTPIGDMFGDKWRPIIPSNFYPLNIVAVGTDINGRLLIPNAPSIVRLPSFLGIVGALQAIQAAAENGAFFYQADIVLSRKESRGNFGGARPTVYNYYSSPRLGFQLGSQFKNQAYVSVRSAGNADTTLGLLTWLNFDTVSGIEYATNSRFRPLYLIHGKIASVTKISDEICLIKLFKNSFYPNSEFKLKGQLYIWSIFEDEKTKVKQYKKITIESENIKIYKDGELIITKEATADLNKIAVNDFFSLSKPWVIDDYSLLFEYELNKDSGFYQTFDQKVKASADYKITILGTWFQYTETRPPASTTIPSETLNLWHLYSDYPETMFVLPSSDNIKVNDQKQPLEFSHQEIISEESAFKGGTLKDGIEKLVENIVNKGQKTIRISIFGEGKQFQNFAPGCLVGEFIKVGEDYFEIVNQPRPVTVEINVKSLTSYNNFVDAMKLYDILESGNTNISEMLPSIDIYQQKFWFINELYYSYPYSKGLWEGYVTYVNKEVFNYKEKVSKTTSQNATVVTQKIEYTKANLTSSVETKTFNINSSNIYVEEQETSQKTTVIKISAQDVKATESLNYDDISKTKCLFLTNRFYAILKLQASDNKNNDMICDNYFKKFNNWYFYNVTKLTKYKILDAYFEIVKTTNVAQGLSSNSSSDGVAQSWVKDIDNVYQVGFNFLTISLLLEGDVKSDFKENLTTGFIFLDSPYQTYTGIYGDMSAFVELFPMLKSDGQYYAWMLGNYYAGTYILSQSSVYPFYLNSFAYGLDTGGRDFPDVQMSTPKDFMIVTSCIQKIGEANRDYVFFVDTESQYIVYKQGSCKYQRELRQKALYCGEPYSIDATDQTQKDAVKKAENFFVVKMVYEVDDNDGMYWFVHPPGDTSNLKTRFNLTPYESFFVGKDNRCVTGLTEFYKLDTYSAAADFYMPFEYYSQKIITTENSDEEKYIACVDTFFPSPTLDSGECIEKIYGDGIDTKTNLIEMLKGNIPSAGEQNTSVKTVEYVESQRLVKDIKYMSAYSDKNASMYFFFCKNTPEFKLLDFDYNEYDKSRPSVFVIKSETSSQHYHSPSNLERDGKNYAYPLMILYDFDLRCVIVDKDETFAYLFGFAYDKNKGPGQVSDYPAYCFLGLYKFDFNGLFIKGNQYLARSKDETSYWYARFPKLNNIPPTPSFATSGTTATTAAAGVGTGGQAAATIGASAIVFGKFKEEFGYQVNEEEVYDISNEDTLDADQAFISILDQSNATFSPSQISASIDDSGRITLFINVENLKYKNVKNTTSNVSGMIALVSADKGEKWEIKTNASKYPIVFNSASETNPYSLGNYLFLINSAGSLVMKKIDVNVNDSYVVAKGVGNQYISAIKKETGEIYVYYYNRRGLLTASISSDDGSSWKTMNNW